MPRRTSEKATLPRVCVSALASELLTVVAALASSYYMQRVIYAVRCLSVRMQVP